MESPRKFNDCYFYYYSTCTKGDNCVFRHEPSALGCETMCTAWQQGKCLDKRCKLRHMELRKNRKQIPCYWETQPGGCRKKHCPFMHKNPDARTDGIAPAQPVPQQPAAAPTASSAPEAAEPLPVAPAVPAPAPVPLLWQQQRQVVLDSAILGVLPASSELLGARRVMPHPHPHDAHAHAHAHAHAAHAAGAYAQLPVDPLVVNFEEESDNESAPSWTPTKRASPADGPGPAPAHELLLLERIQAEAAAFYSYEAAPPPAAGAGEPPPRAARPRALAATYTSLSLDEIAGAAPPAARRRPSARRPSASLDFKVLSLEEIRARKKAESTVVHAAPTPITLNLSRKRKLSTQETITTTGDKIIKVVRSNSIVYKKVDPEAPATANPPKTDQKQSEPSESSESRKRTFSECDIYDMQDDELVDNCYEFKKIKLAERSSKPKLIRNRCTSTNKVSLDSKEDEGDAGAKTDNDSDSEVQIVSVELADRTDVDLSDTEVIEVGAIKAGEPIAIVDLSDDQDSDVVISDGELDVAINNVPDVVASCQKSKVDSAEKELLQTIDDILDADL